jgi:[acyl-carrier-protein] S-malonyltransferase
MMIISPEKTAFLFPGQGSQFVGMGLDLTEKYNSARKVFDIADRTLGISISKLCFQGPSEELNDTVNTQPCLLAHSIAALEVFKEYQPDFTPAYVAGHSLGELSALVASSSLSFPRALKLTWERGNSMKLSGELKPGGMAAVLGLDIPKLDSICQQASDGDEIVQVANDNCPGQVVISGSRNALDRALQLALENAARRVIPLAVSIAAHSPLMLVGLDGYSQAVEQSGIHTPSIPIIGNVNAQPMTTTDQISMDLKAQFTSRVRWTETIQLLISQGIDTFLEMGSGSVLTSLLKRIDSTVKGYAFGKPEDFEILA